MKTPSRKEVLARARELYVADMYRTGTPQLGDINPTEQELIEGGYTVAAKSDLMYSAERKYVEWLELEKTKEKQPLETEEFSIDINEAMKTGIAIFGGRQSGKSNLGKVIAQKLIDKAINVFVVDPTCAWFDLGLPTISLEEPKGKQTIRWQDASTLFDTSRLSPYWQQKFIEAFNREIVEVAIRRGKQAQPRTFIIYEEAHTSMPNHILNSKGFRQTKRLLTQGANFNVSFCVITQFASMIDKLPVKAAQQRFFGRTSEANDLRYLRYYLGGKTEELKTLETGQFIYTFGNQTKKVQTPLFQKNIKVAETLTYSYHYDRNGIVYDCGYQTLGGYSEIG